MGGGVEYAHAQLANQRTRPQIKYFSKILWFMGMYGQANSIEQFF